MAKGSILIVEDEIRLRELLSRILSLEGYEIHETGITGNVLSILEKNDIHVVLTDVRLPDGNGIDLVKKIKQKYPSVEVIVLTAYGNIPDSVEVMKSGAFDYITKGDENNKIIPVIAKALDKVRVQQRYLSLHKTVSQQYSFDSIIGTSEKIKVALSLAVKVAATDTLVMLNGETGTGKEVFARSIHFESPRRMKSFVAVNCSAFSHDLLESELFGYKAGAFTGAVKDKKGLFEEAHEGTLFLDEIGEFDMDLQAKLLRVIETGIFIKPGHTRETQVNVRIIAATNRNLEQEVEKKNFRSDLYYRISGFCILLPPLRERLPDIELFARHFLKMFSEKSNKKVLKISAAALDQLKKYKWKGNIRELRNVIERAVILTDTDEINPELLPLEIGHATETETGMNDLASVEKKHIARILSLTHWNKHEAAGILGIGLTTLYRKIEEYRLHDPN